MEIDVEEPDADGAGGAAGDNEEPETPNTRRRFLPSSVGLTVLAAIPTSRRSKRAFPGATTEPNRRCPKPSCFRSRCPRRSARTASQSASSGPWSTGCGAPKERIVRLPVPDGRGEPDRRAGKRRRAASGWRPGIGDAFAPVQLRQRRKAQTEQVRALTVFLVNRRATVHRFYADVELRLSGAARTCLRDGFPAAPRSFRLSRTRIGTCGSPICTIATFANGRWVETRRLAGTQLRTTAECRHARMDRSAADGRGRTRCAE